MARRSRGRGRASNPFTRGPIIDMRVAPRPRKLSATVRRILKGSSTLSPTHKTKWKKGGYAALYGSKPNIYTQWKSRVRYGQKPIPGTWKIDRPGSRSILIVPAGHPMARFRHGYGSLEDVIYRRVDVPRFPADDFIVCVRREQRRQVLHAMNKTGAGKPRQQKPTRSAYSNVRC